MLRVLSFLLTAVLAAVFVASPAHGDPPPPPGAAPGDPSAKLAEAQQQAATLTEQWHEAKDQLTAKLADVEKAKTGVEPARRAAADARKEEDRFRVDSDAVIVSAFETGRLDSLNALLVSDSPQHYLDQLTALETMTSDQRVALDQLLGMVRTTNQSEREVAAAIAAAELAVDEAKRATAEIDKRKKEAEAKIAEAERLLGQLSPAEREARRGPPVAGPLGPITGRGMGVAAMRAAATRMNRTYEWGATGPNSFDCSGLVYWAFQQVGLTMPRSSGQQAGVGRAVSRGSLQPGDLVFFYSPISHVGFYAGDGKILHAVGAGDVVRYSNMADMPFNSARRM